MTKRKIAAWGVVALVLAAAAPLPAADAPQGLSTVEIVSFGAQEERDLEATEWGAALAEIECRRKAFVKATPLTEDELQQLTARYESSLEATIGLGRTSAGKRWALFLPDRLLDMFDMVSGGVTLLGIGAGGEVHVTRWAALGAGVQVVVPPTLMWYYNRNLASPLFAIGIIASAGPYQFYNLKFYGAGLGWKQGRPAISRIRFCKKGRFSLDDHMVQEGWSDPWGVGGGWAAELHPIEIADFFAGLFTAGFCDISRDDFANPNRAKYKMGHRHGEFPNAAARQYTTYNLWYRHPTDVHSSNYPLKGYRVLPAGTPVRNVRRYITSRYWAVEFTTVKEGRPYTVIFQQSHQPKLTFDTFQQRLLGAQTFEEMTAEMSPREIACIQSAEVKIGISKAAVLMTLGYPLEISKKGNAWIYAVDRGKSKTIFFDEAGLTIKPPAVEIQNDRL